MFLTMKSRIIELKYGVFAKKYTLQERYHMDTFREKTEYLQSLNEAFRVLEPFIIGNKPFTETIEPFAEFTSGFIPLRGLALVLVSSDCTAKECAVWREGRVLGEEEVAAFGHLNIPLWCGSFLRGEKNSLFLREISKLAGRAEDDADCFVSFPVIISGELLGITVAEKAEAWTREETEMFGKLANAARSAFINRNYNESQAEQTWVFNQLMDNMRANVYVTDLETDEILFMNKTMRETYKLRQPIGEICWKVLQKGLTQRCAQCPVDRLKKGGGQNAVCTWEEHSTVTGRYYENYDSLMPWTDGRVVHFQQSVDITDNKKMMSAAAYDELTGLLNRRAGKERLEKVLRNAEFEQVPVTLCLYDINLLKMVNDTYGHVEGDQMLITVSKVVSETLEEEQFAFRLSGDEFMIVFYNCTEAGAEVAMKKVIDRLNCERERLGKPYEISFCYGLLQVPHGFSGLTKIITEVDERMYQQKRAYPSSRLNRERAERQDVMHFTYDKEHLYEALAASTDAYIYICNMKTNLYRFPPGMVEEFGLPGEIVYDAGNIWSQLIEDGKRQEFQKQLEDLATGKADIHDLAYRVRNKDGEWVKVHCRGTVSRDENGEAEMFAGIMVKL